MEQAMVCFRLGEIRRVTDAPREHTICDLVSLRTHLTEYSMGPPQGLCLVAPEGDSLTIGIGGSLAFVEFIQASGDPQYLAARGDSDSWHEYVEYDVGGTLNPVPLALCIPVEKAIEIAVHFFLHVRIPKDVEWVHT
jgi:hypothetical protein